VGYCRVPRKPAVRSPIVPLLAASVALSAAACAARQASAPTPDAGEARPASLLPDVSGLAWLGGDRFLAVHDAKYPDEPGLPRVSLLRLPTGLGGVRWTPLRVAFPARSATDLESVARVPDAGGRVRVLVAESGEEVREKGSTRRIFLLEIEGDDAEVVDQVDWPIPTRNVEGIAVGESGGKRVFVFAERADGEPATEIRFAELSLDPLALGPFRSAGAFASPGPVGPDARPISALEVDAAGVVYAASAEDPDVDDGPFRSAVYRIGRIVTTTGRPVVELDRRPALLATLDGLKVEALAARQRADGTVELWVGVDDEYFGGTIRPLPER